VDGPGSLPIVDAPVRCGPEISHDAAVTQLQELPPLPDYLTYGDHRFNPLWDDLRGDPRFEKIVSSLAPKDAR
jgi:hypothetical protein